MSSDDRAKSEYDRISEALAEFRTMMTMMQPYVRPKKVSIFKRRSVWKKSE